ncbi:MAG: hypothetical protein AAFY71_11480 [Bacteroidota bacterium]
MQFIQVLIYWFNPRFLSDYTTVIGHTIYFTNREYVIHHERQAMKSLAHEMVHILDAQKSGWFRFALSYLFPQILAIGVLSFPWLGWWALGFLLFLPPWKAPYRSEYEARAYAIDIINTPFALREEAIVRICSMFGEWGYYRMNQDREEVRLNLDYWVNEAESGHDPELSRVLLIYEMVVEG